MACRRANPFLWTGNTDPKIEAFCGFPRGSWSSRSAKVGAFPFLGGQFRKVSPLIAYSIRGELAEDLQRTPELTVQPAVV